MRFKRGRIPAEILRYENGCPVVACKAEWDTYSKYWSLTFNCPWCGREHRHGGCSGDAPSEGSWASHCTLRLGNGIGDYILEVVETIGS